MTQRIRICSIDGCSNKFVARGFCDNHYRLWKRHGDPLIKLSFDTPEESFAARTSWVNGCLLWTGYTDKKGYGQLRVGDKMKFTHRYAWERVNGPIPAGMKIDHQHHCNPACCNVEHLRLVTNQQNTWNRSGATSDNVSGFRNVARHGRGWRVVVTKDGVPHRFGTYPTVEEAAVVAEQARKDLFGEFAGRG